MRGTVQVSEKLRGPTQHNNIIFGVIVKRTSARPPMCASSLPSLDYHSQVFTERFFNYRSNNTSQLITSFLYRFTIVTQTERRDPAWTKGRAGQK